jgi:nitric oxide reductase NorD protein
MTAPSLDSEEIEQRLGGPLSAVLSPRRTIAAAADTLSALDAAQQEFVILWASAIATTNAELGFQFVHHAAEAIELMPLGDVQSWIEHAVGIYDRDGLFAATAFLEQPQHYADEIGARANAVQFDDVAGILAIYINGLAGRRLNIESADHGYTDTETIHLPPRISLFEDRALNRLAYKTMASYLWAQTWYGTFRLDAKGRSLEQRLSEFDRPWVARDRFDALECIRLSACVERDLPGLHRDWQRVKEAQGTGDYPPHWPQIVEHLQQPTATARTSLEFVPQIIHDEIPAPWIFQGKLEPQKVSEVMTARLERDKAALQSALNEMARELRQDALRAANDTNDHPEPLQFEIRTGLNPETPGEFDIQLTLGGQAMGVPPELQALLQSILQDLGGFPAEYLVAAGDNNHEPRAIEPEPVASNDGLGPATWYPEWDHQRHQYRRDWCALREQDIEPDNEPFVRDTLKKYHGELQHLRKAFEALRGENRTMKRQPEGDDIDFDAVVQAMTDLSLGLEMPPQLFTRTHRHERNIAVMFMVDMSGSTKGWVNDAERESLVLLCQALEILGDRYAIYGFSGMTRKRCELYRIKRFDEPYTKQIEQRISGIRAQDYTRMGVTIRHLSKLLNEIDARTKLLITLSDGKPDDFDGYRGDYGIEDTRQALIEAKRQGIHSFCITIDDEARDYLPHMYGAVNYTIIDDVRKLPLKVAEIYRRLTI